MRRLPGFLISALMFHAPGLTQSKSPSTQNPGNHWIRSSAGPFEVISNANPRELRDALNTAEQFRFSLGKLLGKENLTADPSVRIFLFRNQEELDAAQGSPVLARGRDHWIICAAPGPSLPPLALHGLTKLLLQQNVERLPEDFQSGLTDFFAFFEARGPHITWGLPPPAAQRTRDWARVQMLATSSVYYGRLSALMFNLQKGAPEDVAYRNALSKTRAEIEKELDGYSQAGSFVGSSASGKPIDPERDFFIKQMDPAAVQLAFADRLTKDSEAIYLELSRKNNFAAEAQDGLALLAVRDKNATAARKYLAQAESLGDKNAGTLVEYAKIEMNPNFSQKALEKAITLDPKSAEAQFLLGKLTGDVVHFREAAKLSPQNPAYWEALAMNLLAKQQFGEAAKAWTSAEQSAITDADRDRYHQARMDLEQQRLDYEEAERRRIRDEKEREIKQLKAQAVAELREAEDKANRRALPPSDDGKPEAWWDAPQPDVTFIGTLKQVECVGARIRLTVSGEDGKSVRLSVRDATKLTISGPGELTLKCAAKPERKLSVGYFKKLDTKFGTVGEVGTLELK